MTDKTGGPAFPYVATEDWKEVCYGMTMRDYFAAKAMQGLVARIGCHDAYLIAHDAYIIADAMLAEREKK